MGFKLPSLFRRATEERVPQDNFLVNEEGTVTIFGLMMFVLMVGIGGIAIDIMRYETQRVQLQYTLDRAVLAAASMSNELDPDDVVLDYMARSGLDRYRLNVTFEEGPDFRRVSASAEMDINTIFMDMFGVRALTTPALGVAEENIQNTEISLVLDVSGSMRGDKIADLRREGQDFVELVMEGNDYVNDEMRVSMSVIPYNGMVNVGSVVSSVYSLEANHSASNCAIFDRYIDAANPGDFGSTVLNPANPLRRMEQFDYYNRGRNWYFQSGYCPEDDRLAILPWSSDINELQTFIANLPADGWTAIDVGMRWGVALLDPSAQPALTGLRTNGLATIHEDFADRPAEWQAVDDGDTVKYLILMTDGANTEQHDLRERFTGESYVQYNDTTDTYSVYVPELDEWRISTGTYANPVGFYSPDPAADSVPIDWEVFWTRYTATALAGQLYYYPYAERGVVDTYWDIRSDFLEIYSGDEAFTNVGGAERAQWADANLQAMCDTAREQGIVVFTIAFDAPARGIDAMRGCVGPGLEDQNRFYNVDGDRSIGDAFDSIAATINLLRLTQ